MEKDFEKKAKRAESDKVAIIKRLNILTGQIEGVKKMVNAGAYCDDVLVQLSSIFKSVKSLSNFVIERHIETCVAENLKKGKLEVLKELNSMYKRFQ